MCNMNSDFYDDEVELMMMPYLESQKQETLKKVKEHVERLPDVALQQILSTIHAMYTEINHVYRYIHAYRYSEKDSVILLRRRKGITVMHDILFRDLHCTDNNWIHILMSISTIGEKYSAIIEKILLERANELYNYEFNNCIVEELDYDIPELTLLKKRMPCVEDPQPYDVSFGAISIKNILDDLYDVFYFIDYNNSHDYATEPKLIRLVTDIQNNNQHIKINQLNDTNKNSKDLIEERFNIKIHRTDLHFSELEPRILFRVKDMMVL